MRILPSLNPHSALAIGDDHAAAAPGRISFTILTSKGSFISSAPVFFERSKWGVARNAFLDDLRPE
jgi:hypothetical protein